MLHIDSNSPTDVLEEHQRANPDLKQTGCLIEIIYLAIIILLVYFTND